ncbi:uncharacterized protein LOC144701303 [Wolffia australiana]
MDFKQLDFNAPLPSVRRLGSPLPSSPILYSNVVIPSQKTRLKSEEGEFAMRRSPLPAYTSDSVSGPIQKPGVVPFSWEQRPGQPKDGFLAGGTPDSLRRSLATKKEETAGKSLDSTVDHGFGRRSLAYPPQCSVPAKAVFPVPSPRSTKCLLRSLDKDKAASEKRRSRKPFSRADSCVLFYTLLPKGSAAKFLVENSSEKRRKHQTGDKNSVKNDKDDDETGQIWLRMCGILPRFCSKTKPKSWATCKTDTRSSASGNWEESEFFESNRLSYWSSSSNLASSSLVRGGKNYRSPAKNGSTPAISSVAGSEKNCPDGNLHQPLSLPQSPETPATRPTLGALFRESSNEESFSELGRDAMVDLSELRKGQMRFADVFAWPASED